MKLTIDTALKQSYTNLIKFIEELDMDYSLYKEDSSGLHYRSDLGYEYNPFAEKELHEGYLYSSVFIKPEGTFFRSYIVKNYDTANIVYQGKLMSIKSNQSKDCYEDIFKQSFQELLENKENNIRSVHPK